MAEAPPLPDDVLELGRRVAPAPVFIVGCARSGTSIFGECLAAHPKVVYLFEPRAVWSAGIPERDDHRLTRRDATPDVARRIYDAFARVIEERCGGPAADRTLVEKNPKHVLRMAFLDALFPRARFVHIIRDGRDVVASLLFRNRGREWGHLEIPGWRDLLAKYPDENWIRCAYQWKTAVTTARSEGRALGTARYLEIRYEDLVRSPVATLGPVFSFLDLDLDEHVRAFAEKIQDATADSYHARKQLRHYVENHSRRIGRYEENLDERQQRDVLEVCGDLLRELGYAK